jgi:hypothetical protein
VRRPLSPLVLPVALALGAAACGIDTDVVAREAAEAAATAPVEETTTTEAPPEEPEPEPVASPFTAEAPEGYEEVVVGAGEEAPGADDHAVTVLAPGADPVDPGVVLVEAAPSGSDSADADEPEDVDGWTSVAGDGVRVWGAEADPDELEAVADAATAPEAPGTAPVVEDPPGDLEVVGRIGAAGVVALRAALPGDDGPVPGPTSAQVTGWAADDGSLVALTLPAGTLDPIAVAAEATAPRRTVDQEREAAVQGVFVGDATGVVTTTTDVATDEVVRRELAVATPWGDVLVLIARGDALLDAEALVAVAESIDQA